VIVASVMGTLFWPTAVYLRISDRGALDKQLLMTAGGGFPLDSNDGELQPLGGMQRSTGFGFPPCWQ